MKINFLFPALLICLFVFSANAQTKQPRTVRDFFNLLPQKYFTLEGCMASSDKNCNKARREYIDSFLEIEDTPNGYWKSGCDGAQSCLTMALFKRPNAAYTVVLKIEFESGTNNYFLEYRNGKWFDIAARDVPGFSKNNIYEIPRNGTTVEVFAKDKNTEFGGKGKKLYDLVWKNGKFSVKR
ncbi:MAG TPA: hypothetical protein VNB22_05935 [Pyrinomonadaceae bacterium]|nr:hypothetical protein [Pyrinomonadaceae bacterium]